MLRSLYEALNWGRVGDALDLLDRDVEWSDGSAVGFGVEAVERDLRSHIGLLGLAHHVHEITPLDGSILVQGIAVRDGGFPRPFFHLFDMRDGRVTRRRVFDAKADAIAAASSHSPAATIPA